MFLEKEMKGKTKTSTAAFTRIGSKKDLRKNGPSVS